ALASADGSRSWRRGAGTTFIPSTRRTPRSFSDVRGAKAMIDTVRVDDETADIETIEDMILQGQVERFLYREARLLDERKLTDWLDLLADDLVYWMPMRRNIKFGDWDLEFTSADTEINWFDEGKDVLAGRIRQLNTGVHWPEEPVSRFEHFVTNV